MSRSVVITGLGAVTGFGVGIDPLWSALTEGRSCLAPISAFDASGFRSRFAGQARDFNVRDHVPKHYRKAVKVMARDIELAVGAAASAVSSAGLTTKANDPDAAPTYHPSRIGCQIGAGLIAADVPELAAALSTSTDDSGAFSYQRWGESAMDNLTPLWLLKYLPNMLACHVTILHDAQGPSNTITCGEASGGLSIGEAMRVIQRADADLCFAGGAESKLNPMGMIRWDLAGRLAQTPGDATDPTAFIRPYDPHAPGSLIGEGGGILVLEHADAAAQRGAEPLARLTGFGAGQSPISDDPEARAQGLTAAIRAALHDADITPDDIDAIVPQAMGVRTVDAEEAHALRRIFADRLADIPLACTTPFTGDLVAGSMAVNAAVGVKMLAEQRLPARIHPGTPAPPMQAHAAPSEPRALRNALVTTTSMAGQNAALVFSRPHA